MENEWNASKSLSHRVYTSYGVLDHVLKLLDQLERIQFQLANCFSYNIAVSRVEPRIVFSHPLYFTFTESEKLSSTIFIYDGSRARRANVWHQQVFEDWALEFRGHYTVQVG